jgi:hypothetical protein
MADDNHPMGQPDFAPAIFEEQAADHIRRVWHEGRWWFSIIDVIGLLTDSKRPRKYWADMKQRITDEGFVALSGKVRLLKLCSSDGKLYATDCADFSTMMTLLAFLPAWGRNQSTLGDEESEGDEETSIAGIYAITNIMTQEQYIGSARDIPLRLQQHRALLLRGNHHARKLQAAWNRDGAAAFRFEILERVPDVRLLPAVEQRYLDTLKPAYNSADVAVNSSAAVPISADRLRTVIVELYESSEINVQSPILHVIKEAMITGALRPGPNFHRLLEAEQAPIALKVNER